MAKKLDLSKSVYELVSEYPELVEIMSELGFSEITKPVMLQSVGRIMTIPKGAKAKDIPMMSVVMALMQAGFELEGQMPAGVIEEASDNTNAPYAAGEEGPNESPDTEASREPAPDTESAARDDAETAAAASPTPVSTSDTPESELGTRIELLKSYLRRLGEGEDLESVRVDFAEAFGRVDSSEIMRAEQEILKEGTPLEEVQRLCDVHSALFHGATARELVSNMEDALANIDAKIGATSTEMQEHEIAAPAPDQAPELVESAADSMDASDLLIAIEGHPLQTFTRENHAISTTIDALRGALLDKADGNTIDELFARSRELSIHYAKKGDLLFPLLKTRYGIYGPSEVMWTVDDEVRDEMGVLEKEAERGESWAMRLDAVLTRAEEMIYKEENILFPICAANFSEEEWMGIYRDAKDYSPVMGVEPSRWEEAEAALAADANLGAVNHAHPEDEIVMPGGHLTTEQLTALLNTVPLEITFIDADNINRFFNEGPKVFKRPGMAIDRDVFSCHPPKIEPMVRAIIEDFRSGARDSVEVWMDKGGRTMLVRYMAVRDAKGTYLGTVEVVQDMEFAKEHFGLE